MQQWHILCVEPNRESTASAHLLGRRYRPFVPLAPRSRRRTIGPMFPGYLFCLLDPEQEVSELSAVPRLGGYQAGDVIHTRKQVFSVAMRVKSIPGVRDFLHLTDGRYATLSEPAITAISELAERLTKNRNEPSYPFTIGSRVRTTDSAGVWSGIQGIVERLDKKDQVVLSVILPGKQMPLTLRADWLELEQVDDKQPRWRRRPKELSLSSW